jgi:hypothetical protein
MAIQIGACDSNKTYGLSKKIQKNMHKQLANNFFILIIVFVQNSKKVERLVVLTTQQLISEICTVGRLFCILRPVI